MVMSPIHQVWPKHLAGHNERGKRKRQRWEDNIREWTGLEFGKSQWAVENRGK